MTVNLGEMSTHYVNNKSSTKINHWCEENEFPDEYIIQYKNNESELVYNFQVE